MNNPTAAQLSQDSLSHFDQAAAYTGDMLITVLPELTICQLLDDEITLDMGQEY